MDEQEALINGLQSQLQRAAADVASRDGQLASLNAEAGSLRTRVTELTRVTDQQLLQARPPSSSGCGAWQLKRSKLMWAGSVACGTGKCRRSGASVSAQRLGNTTRPGEGGGRVGTGTAVSASPRNLHSPSV